MTRRDEMLENLDNYIQTAMPGWEIPGLAVAIVKDDALVFAKGFGVCELGKNEPVDEDTIFAIGSITKGFTVAALGMLVQEGKLSWDDPVTRHLPGFQMHDPYVTREITIRDLLCHRSGLPTWGGDLVGYGSILTRAELIERIRTIPPAFSFRSGFGYSNLMFLTAGQIIPAVTGISWDDFVRQRILKPLGMLRSNTNTIDLARMTNVAIPHEMVGEHLHLVPYRSIDNDAPAGAINSSVRDMAQWMRLQLNNGIYEGKRLLDEEIIEEMRIPHNNERISPAIRKLIPSRHFLTYGLGWNLSDYQGRFIVRHDGGIDGMLSILGLVPEEKLGIVVLSNNSMNYLIIAIFYHVLDAYLEAAPRDWNQILHELDSESTAGAAAQRKQFQESRVQGTRLTLPLQEYAGTYSNPMYGDATISIQDERLVIQLSHHPTLSGALEHWHYDSFLCRWSDPVFDKGLVPFILDGQGKVEAFRLKVREDMVDPLEYTFRRKADK